MPQFPVVATIRLTVVNKPELCMSTTLQTKPLMTLEEFFAWDGGGHQGKLELVDGVVRAMAPASATHAIIQGNLVYAIGAHQIGRAHV